MKTTELRADQQVQERLLRLRAVSEALSVSRAQAYNLVYSGEIPAVRINRSIRVPATALNQYIAAKIAKGLD